MAFSEQIKLKVKVSSYSEVKGLAKDHEEWRKLYRKERGS